MKKNKLSFISNSTASIIMLIGLAACGSPENQKNNEDATQKAGLNELDSLSSLGFSVMDNFAIKAIEQTGPAINPEKVYLVEKSPSFVDGSVINRDVSQHLVRPKTNVQTKAVNQILKTAGLGDVFVYTDPESVIEGFQRLTIVSEVEPDFTPEGIFIYRIGEAPEPTQLTKNETYGVVYAAFLPDGSLIDHNLNDPNPFRFQINTLSVIKGWEIALSKMALGEKVFVEIPYSLAYGSEGKGPVPPKTNLFFYLYFKEVIEA
jgi:hypothetical protein